MVLKGCKLHKRFAAPVMAENKYKKKRSQNVKLRRNFKMAKAVFERTNHIATLVPSDMLIMVKQL